MERQHVPQPRQPSVPPFTLTFSTHDDHPDAASEIDFGSLAEVRAYLQGEMKADIREWDIEDAEGFCVFAAELEEHAKCPGSNAPQSRREV
jgi:hypothetical protein